MSQLLSRLEANYARESDPTARAILSAQIANVLIRHGRFSEAKTIIDDLRQSYGAGQNGWVTVWIMLAEGLLHFYSDLNPLALDRISRAQLLGAAMSYKRFVGVASAWKAHIEFENSRFSSMTQSLRDALSSAENSDHDAQTRLSMVLANSFAICGQHEAAQLWFKKAHAHAVSNGDQASIEALLYNRAAFRLAWLRAESCFRAVGDTELRDCHTDIESVKNLQRLTGISALDHHIYLWEARLLILERDYLTAIEKLQNIRKLGPFAQYNFSQSLIDLEIEFCAIQSSQSDGLHYSTIPVFTELDVDDQMIATWMLISIAHSSPALYGEVESIKTRFANLRALYERTRVELRRDLVEFVCA